MPRVSEGADSGLGVWQSHLGSVILHNVALAVSCWPVICSGEEKPQCLAERRGLHGPQMPPLLACQVDSLQLHPRGRLGRASPRSAEARAQGLGHGALSSFLSLTSQGQHVVIMDVVMLVDHIQIRFLAV